MPLSARAPPMRGPTPPAPVFSSALAPPLPRRTTAPLGASASGPARGVERLGAWAAARAKEAEVVAQLRDADAPVADRALDSVRAFIVERGLILYGGLAIDYALRLRGSGIYPPHQTPDFDVFSPNHVDDAYALADRLHVAGFDDVGAIRAIHVQTMRVRTSYIFVADISYAPPAVYETLPTVSYAGMRVLHPDYQRTDMHLAFCFPLSNPPREDVFHRFGKDLRRFNLLERFYPITTGETLAQWSQHDAMSHPPAVGGRADQLPVTAEVLLDGVALHGFAAYGLLRAALAELLEAAGSAGVAPAPGAPLPPLLAVAVGPGAGGTARVGFAPPACPGLEGCLLLATPWPAETVAALCAARGADASVAWHAPYMDSRPLMATVAGGAEAPVAVYSTRDRLLAVSVLRVGALRVQVVSPQYLMLHFLYEAHVAPRGPLRDLQIKYYRATLAVLQVADEVIGRLRSEGGGPEVPAATYRRFVESSPFGLTVQTLGGDNRDPSYLIRLAQSAQAVGDRPPGVDLGGLPDLAGLPLNYHPARSAGRHHPVFDYARNPAFLRAGEAIPPPSFVRPEAPVTGGGEEASPGAGAKTYLALFAWLDPGVLPEVLGPLWRPVSLAEAAEAGRVDLVALEGQSAADRRVWGVRSRHKSLVDAAAITSKVALHALLGAEAPALIAETFTVEAGARHAPRLPPGVWIWRPEGGFAGRGIHVVDDQDGLGRVWGAFAGHARPGERALLSRYIVAPALCLGKKFHLRLLYLVVVPPPGEGPRRAALYRRGGIILARKPYVAGEYHDAGIHDTHASTGECLAFPQDYPGGADEALRVFAGALATLARVSELALPGARSYPEAEGGFEVLGCDFMVDAGGRVVLLEINTKTGYRHSTDVTAVTRRIYGGVAEFALADPGDGMGTSTSGAALQHVTPCYPPPSREGRRPPPPWRCQMG